MKFSDREIYSEEKLILSVELEAGKIKVVDSSVDSGFGIRVSDGKKMGFGFANTKAKAEELAGKSMVRRFYGFPAQGPKGREVFHEVPMDPEVLVARVKEMAGRMNPATSITAFSAVIKRSIQNSNGIDFEEKQSWIGYSAYTASGGSEGWESWEGREDKQGKWLEVAEKAQEWSDKWRGAGKQELKGLPVVLSARAASSLLGQMLLPNINAERAMHGQTALQIGGGSGNIKIVNSQKLHTASFDGEGIAPKTFTVFDKNLKTFLHSFSTAKEMEAEPTANAGRDWKSFPVPSPFDLEVLAKKSDALENYVFVNDLSGVHTVDPTAGRFSVEAHQAFMMPDEEPVQPFIISGSLEGLLDSEAVGSPEQRGSFYLPGLKIDVVM